jgi:hypothetical protein
MQRDILFNCGGFLAVGLALWAFWGNPPISASIAHGADIGPGS